MLSFLPGIIKGIIAFIIFAANTVLWVALILLFTPFRIIFPFKRSRRIISVICLFFAEMWVRGNNFNMALMYRIDWDIKINGDLNKRGWYLVISNHQTWNDIVVVMKVFLNRIPFLKFFIKEQLKWAPFIGVGCMALEFPFMKRYSKEFLAKNPHLKGKDIEATKKACEKYREVPTSIMNFMEGTRFSLPKHNRQGSPYMNLLKPKAGGISLVLGSMGDILHSIADVTVFYPEGAKTFWEFLCGKTTKIVVRVNIVPITDEILGDYANDPEFAVRFQKWINDFWFEKDRLIEELKTEYGRIN